MNANRAVIILLCLFVSTSSAETTINDVNRYAYGANIGWGDFQGDTNAGVVIGEFVCSGFAYFANIGWVHFGDGSPTNGFAYGNDNSDDFGINHDGVGNLRGFAYGANVGWINFETNGTPKFDLLTGALSGFAYGANVGWIGLSNQFAYVQTDTMDHGPDTDGDDIPDQWEMSERGNLTDLGGGTNDFDADGMTDVAEYASDTDPNNIAEFMAITSVELISGSATSEVTWASQPSRFYHLETASAVTNSSNWADSGLGVVSPDVGAETIRGVATGSDALRFYRVQAVLPLWNE